MSRYVRGLDSFMALNPTREDLELHWATFSGTGVSVFLFDKGILWNTSCFEQQVCLVCSVSGVGSSLSQVFTGSVGICYIYISPQLVGCDASKLRGRFWQRQSPRDPFARQSVRGSVAGGVSHAISHRGSTRPGTEERRSAENWVPIGRGRGSEQGFQGPKRMAGLSVFVFDSTAVQVALMEH